MKVALNIKNMKKAIRPANDDVIIFDGKDWYITTKETLFKEYQDKVDAKIAEVNAKVAEMEAYKRETSSQIAELAKVIKQFVQMEGDN